MTSSRHSCEKATLSGSLAEMGREPISGTMERVTEVTLVVEEWNGVEPGRLAWIFPDLEAALEAARTMRNAARWLILAGRSSDIEHAREEGLVLAESA